MITMLDADGDGQVNYEEFHRMVIDPDPSRPDFGTEILKAEPKESGIMSEVSVLFFNIIIVHELCGPSKVTKDCQRHLLLIN